MYNYYCPEHGLRAPVVAKALSISWYHFMCYRIFDKYTYICIYLYMSSDTYYVISCLGKYYFNGITVFKVKFRVLYYPAGTLSHAFYPFLWGWQRAQWLGPSIIAWCSLIPRVCCESESSQYGTAGVPDTGTTQHESVGQTCKQHVTASVAWLVWPD